MKRKRVVLIVVACLALVLVVAAAVSWPRQYLVAQTETGTTYIEMQFDQVRKILTRTEATPEILRRGKTGELVEYTWVHRGLGSGTFSLKLHFVAQAKLKVQTADEDYVGSHLIELKQDVEVKESFVHSRVEMTKGTGRLREYVNVSRFTSDGERTKVETSIKLGILVTAPNWARSYAKSRVSDNAGEKVGFQEIATRDVIEGYRDKPLPWLPSL